MKKSWLTLAFAIAAITFSLAVRAQAQTFTTLSSFCSQTNCADGEGATAPPVQGTDGNIYGETASGGLVGTSYCGSAGCGTIFKMTPQGVRTTIHMFCLSATSTCTDGAGPSGGLLLATDGNFYGLTNGGGVSGWGTVFKITPAGKLTTLHNFNLTDGWPQSSGVIQADNGNFYGTTTYGGINGEGTVFEITSGGAFTSLYSFPTNPVCPLCTKPSGLTQGADGNIYGTTLVGGVTDNCNTASTGGTFFQLTPAGLLSTLAVFCRLTGFYPNSPLVLAANGNFYGTTTAGGVSTQADQGTVYEMTTTGSITSLYSFCLQTDCPDGKTPIGLALGTDGNFYGTTELANPDYKGTIYEITPAGQLTTLHTFTPTNNNFLGGSDPIGPMLLHTSGTFYGITASGGKHGIGSIFSFATGLQPFVKTVPTSGATGTNVIILGNNLTGATAVSFNGTAAKFKVISASEITASVPTHATSGTLTVTTAGGKKLKSNVTFRVQ